jgi:hypothetical protein
MGYFIFPEVKALLQKKISTRTGLQKNKKPALLRLGPAIYKKIPGSATPTGLQSNM